MTRKYGSFDPGMGITEKRCLATVYHQSMTDDHSRPDAAPDEHAYLLSVEEAADRYAAAGHPRTIRAIQKYCRRGDLESQKVETTYGERYLISPASIDRHIAMIIERSQASGHEQPRPAAIVRRNEIADTSGLEAPENVREQPRPAAAEFQDRYMAHLEKENTFLREQNTVLLERVKETNILTGRLQEMLTPLLGSSDRPVKSNERDHAASSGPNGSPQQG
jgi:hypothetical protein